MNQFPVVRVAALFLAAVGVFAACSGRPAVQPPPADLGVVAGRVFKAAVKDSTVTVYRLEGVQRGAVAGTATTDADGAFRVAVGTSTGPFLVVATGGSFIDEATAVTVQLNSAELTALIPVFDVETKLESVRVTPVSHLAAGLALYWTKAEGQALAAADTEAWTHLNQHFGALDWRTATPNDVTTATGATLDEPTKQGLLLAALSMQARLIAEGAGLTPGGRVNPLALTAALYDDVTADGFFDGVGPTGRLVLPQGGTIADGGLSATALDGQTARTAFAQGIAKFLASDRNVTRVTVADVQQLVNAIATNDDQRIFRGTSGPADIEPPVITFVKPGVDMAGVRAVVELEVRAVDGVAIKSFAFTTPASLVATAATPTADGKSSVLLTTLDVSALPEGPLALTVRAVDTSNNESSKSITLVVSNRGPTIAVNSPSNAATVTGFAAISATATAQAGSIAKLELRMPPPGAGADTLPAADSLGVTWNTLSAPEGLVTLTFHAEDTLGGIADTTVSVTVDNVPFGVVTTTATLGAPVGGLSVQLVAIDDATGQPVMGRAGGPVLGSTATGATTDPGTGSITFTLNQENYDGPVQLVASGTTASYVDPTGDVDAGAVNIALPTNFTLTSFVRRYRSGDPLNVPLTGWTTLADDATLAYAQGRNPAAPDAGTLGAALTVIEPLFPAHVSRPTAWPLRTVFPVSLTTGTQGIRDVLYAALPDVGLNQLARDLAVDVGLTPGTGFALPQVLTALRQDISDGQFDGRNGSLQLVTGGTAPYSFDANTSRFKLAVGMDRFIRSPANKTGLIRQDLQTSSVYDNVSGDVSILYPSSVAPIPFDNVPPVITWTVTFANGGQLTLPPYLLGTTKLVAGVVSIQATATDISGVASINADVNGQPLTAAMGSSNSLFKATFDTTTLADGTFTFTANACDRLANCGSSTYAVDSDNTVPTVSTVKPLPGFYSASFDLEALASDNNRLGLFEVQPPADATGLADQDAQLNRVYAPATSWSVGAAATDGVFPVGFRACDVVANCATATVAPTLDRTPPTVSITSTVPQYTNQSSLTLAISATDGTGAGVSRVLVSRNGSPPVAATLSGSSWTTSVSLPAPGQYTINVWAEDTAQPTNSGQGRSSPYQVTASLLLDTAPPTISFANFASYVPETALNFQRMPSGAPVMPVVYVYQSPTKLDLSPDTAPVVKAASRLSWGPSAPSGAELETTNVRNVPFVQAQVGYNSTTESPIAQARFRFTSIAGTTAWTNAIPAARTGTNVLYFDCPIVLETLPSLATWGSATRTYVLEVNMTDAANNTWTVTSGASGTAKTLTVVPPPIAFVRDTTYTSRGDAKSIYAYRIANQTWDDFFDPVNANFAGDNYARHTRFLVYNPSDAPVAIAVRAAPTSVNGTQRETWSNVNYVVAGLPSDTYASPDGYTFRVGPYWDSRTGSNFVSGCTSDPQFTSPCGTGTKATLYPAHINGIGLQWSCQPIPLSTTQTWSTPGLGALGVFRVFKGVVTASTGVETTGADTVSTGYVVPGAAGTTAGSIAVYQASPRPTRGTAPALLYQPSSYDPASRYQYWRGDFWVPIGDGYSCNITRPDLTSEAYAARRWYQQLQDATSTFNTIGAVVQTSGVTSGAPYTHIGGFTDYATATASIAFSH